MFVPRIWGVRSLAPFYPEKSNMPEPIGEVWLTGIDCGIASGPFQGKTLGEAWREMKTLWRGTLLKNAENFPILVKFIFPSDKLSIQVHPDDAYAEAHEAAAGGRGKTEMWHAISATTGAQVLVGLKPGIDKERFLDGLAQRTLENLFEVYPVRTGDTFFVPAGTPHTIGPNMVVFEVQEYSDLTYRVYDYDRVDAQGNPRKLHVAKALEVMNFGAIKGGKVPALELSATGLKKELLAGCRYFVAERWEFSKPTELYTNGEHFNILIFLSGEGEIEAEDQRVSYHRGEVWFVPACIASPKVVPGEPTTFLRAYVADMEDFKSNLLDEGFGAASIAQTVFE